MLIRGRLLLPLLTPLLAATAGSLSATVGAATSPALLIRVPLASPEPLSPPPSLSISLVLSFLTLLSSLSLSLLSLSSFSLFSLS
ncbi:hypothetical protein Syun_009994 [Stephania yunnanensis]|uniref:Secreted peptide n=1 Tax=Stephania yunnanensis TaxID=152371 RepID=A0AAP0KGN7_9MAGN